MSRAGSADAADAIPLPFAGGSAVRIIQGYNGGTHQGRSRYALDLVLAGGGTSGAPVVSPVTGVVAWAQAPGGGNGCLAVGLRDGSYSVVLCHVILDHALRPGESLALGQPLGSVGPAGAVGNNGTPHVHLELHRGGHGNNPVPFGSPGGLSLAGTDLPASGAANEHASLTLPGSGNAAASSPPAPAQNVAPRVAPAVPTPAPAPAPPEPPARQQAAAVPAPAPPAPRSAPAPTPRPPAVAASPRSAVVEGTGACLKVHEQPGLDGPIVDCVWDGTEVQLGEAVEHTDALTWRQVRGLGWVAAEFLRRTRAVITGTGSCLNVRDAPSTLGAVLTCLPEGTSVAVGESVQGDFGGWVRITLIKGADAPAGWALDGFLS